MLTWEEQRDDWIALSGHRPLVTQFVGHAQRQHGVQQPAQGYSSLYRSTAACTWVQQPVQEHNSRYRGAAACTGVQQPAQEYSSLYRSTTSCTEVQQPVHENSNLYRSTGAMLYNNCRFILHNNFRSGFEFSFIKIDGFHIRLITIPISFGKGWNCKAGREWFTPKQIKRPKPHNTNPWKVRRRRKTVEDK